MIAEMKGLGMGESRVRAAWATARRTAVAVATAAVIVLVGSRVNRPGVVGLQLPERARVADEVLADVRLDERSLTTVVDSINAAAGRRRVRLDWESLGGMRRALEDALTNGPAPQRLRDVRLGQVLGRAAEPWFYGLPIEWRQEAGEIVIAARGARSRPAGVWIYDVRDLLEGADAYSSQLRGDARPLGQPSGPLSAAEFAQMINDSIFPYSWQPNALPHVSGWGGWLIFRGDEAGQRKLEQFLTLLRRGDSGPVMPRGGAR
jgi:hypothetical protein